MFSQFDKGNKAKGSSPKEFKTKQYFKENQLSGLYQDVDPYTGRLKEEGNFSNGNETGIWKVYD